MIHICLASDENYMRFTLMCIHDIVIRKNPETEIMFHILADDISEESITKLGYMASIPTITIKLYTLSSKKLIPNRTKQEHISPTTYLRFYIPELVKEENVKRILYIDCDMLARKDLTELYNMDLGGKALGCTLDSFFICVEHPEEIPWKKSDINAGLLLMDIPKLLELDFTNKCLDAMEGNNDNDQTIIDRVMKDEIHLLPPHCQLPMHNLVHSRFGTTRMLYIENWNKFHHTNYASLQELLDKTFLWHFHEDKTIYLKIPVIRKIYDVCETRLKLYLMTGKLVHLEEGEDDCFELNCREVIQQHLDDETLNKNEPVKIDWKKYVDAIYCINYIPNQDRLRKIMDEMDRVGIRDSGILHFHFTFDDPQDNELYKIMNHDLLDQETDNKKLAINLCLAYYRIFKEAEAFGYHNILILEDDAVFLNNLLRIQQALEHIPDDADVVHLGKHAANYHKDRIKTTQLGRWYCSNYTGGYWGSEATIFSRKAIQLGVEMLTTHLIAADCIFENRDDDRLNDLKRYIATINVTVQNSKKNTASYFGLIHTSDYNFS